MLSTWDSTFGTIQLLKSQDHHLSLTIIDGLSSWAASSQVREIYAAYENGEIHLPRFQPPPAPRWFVPLDKNGSCEIFDGNSNLCLLLSSFAQCFITLSLKGFNVILASMGTSMPHHGSTLKWCVSSMLRWRGKSLGLSGNTEKLWSWVEWVWNIVQWKHMAPLPPSPALFFWTSWHSHWLRGYTWDA